jgi:hypothetical protein
LDRTIAPHLLIAHRRLSVAWNLTDTSTRLSLHLSRWPAPNVLLPYFSRRFANTFFWRDRVEQRDM